MTPAALRRAADAVGAALRSLGSSVLPETWGEAGLNTWEGPAADDFRVQLEVAHDSLDAMVSELEQIRRRLYQQADELEAELAREAARAEAEARAALPAGVR